MTSWLQPLSEHWLASACAVLATEPAVIRVSIVSRRGSAPRETGATLLVSGKQLLGTIGGGQLEWQALKEARAMLDDAQLAAIALNDFTLGPDLNQCCGGRVQVWLERMTAAELPALERTRRLLRGAATGRLITHFTAGRVARHVSLSESAPDSEVRCLVRSGSLTLIEGWQQPLPPLWIFGAGHVGQAVVKLLLDLPLFDVTCIDSRPELLPAGVTQVRIRHHQSPAECLPEAPPGTRFLVMTHDHALDYQLCRTVLARSDAAWLGLIGSASKGARFRSRLRREGFSAASIASLCSPIGLGALSGRLPAAIAVSVVAQLLGQLESRVESQQPKAQSIAGDCDGNCAECGSLRIAT